MNLNSTHILAQYNLFAFQQTDNSYSAHTYCNTTINIINYTRIPETTLFFKLQCPPLGQEIPCALQKLKGDYHVQMSPMTKPASIKSQTTVSFS